MCKTRISQPSLHPRAGAASDRRGILLGVLLLNVVAESSPWGLGWDSLVAVGTMLLAVGTALLAASTRKLATRTAEEVEHSGKLVLESQRQVDATLAQSAIAQGALGAWVTNPLGGVASDRFKRMRA